MQLLVPNPVTFHLSSFHTAVAAGVHWGDLTGTYSWVAEARKGR